MYSDFSREQLEWVLGDDATNMNIQSLDVALHFCKGMIPYFDSMMDAGEIKETEERIDKLVAELSAQLKKLRVTGTLTEVLDQTESIEPTTRWSKYIKKCVDVQIEIIAANGLENKTLLNKTIAKALTRYLKGNKDPFNYGEF